MSRSFAQPSADDAAPPVFPLLAFAYTACAEHWSLDYVGYVDRLSHPEQPHTAEEALGLDVINDMNQAFFSLVWDPFGAAMTRRASLRA